MGLDLASVFEQAKKSAETGMNDLLKQGANAGLGYLEQQAIDTIKADQSQHVQAYQQATADMLKQPAKPNSFSAYLSGITQSPVIKQYGPYIIGGVALVVIATLVMKGK